MKLTRTEIKWIINELEAKCRNAQESIDMSKECPINEIINLRIANYENLIEKLSTTLETKIKRIEIV